MRRWKRTAAKRRPTARQAPVKRRSSWGRGLLVEQLEDRLALSATVFTDQPNYVPGAVAQIAGNGFDPGEQVTLQIINGDGSTLASGGSPWTVNVGTDGSFTSAWTVASADSGGAAFFLNAAGTDGDSATTKFAANAISSQPQLKMDSWNYQPGATAQITGSNFAPNETVTLQVVHSDTGQLGDGDNPWSATTGADGSFTSAWYVNPSDSPGASFTVTASGSQGDSASADFIDGTELMNNGGFETGVYSGWSLSGNTAYTSVSTFSPHSGSYAAQLGPLLSGGPGHLYQYLATVPNQQYTVSWWLENDAGGENEFEAFFSGVKLFDASSMPAQGYTHYSYTVTATQNGAALEFFYYNTPSYFHLDDVSVQGMAYTTVAVTSSGNSGSTYGQSVSFTASVQTYPSGPGASTGAVQFAIDGSNFGSPVNVIALPSLPDAFATSPSISLLSAGNHTITATYSDGSSYASSSGSMTQVVSAAPLRITADNKSMTYGGPLPALTASYSGFVNGDTSSSLTTRPTLSTTATASSAVGSYSITASGAVDPNYTISYAAGTLSVTKATPTINWPTPTNITYGTALSATQLDATSSWTVAGNNGPVAGTFTYSPPLGTVLGAGDHTLNVTFTPTDTTDYTTATDSVTLHVNQAPLLIIAQDRRMTYGGPLPALTASYGGFVNGETSANLTTQPTLSTAATATSAPGSYSITASGAVDSNYQINYISGTLIVAPATPAINWSTPTDITYGTALSATQLDATSSWTVAGNNGPVAGTFTYSPPLGTVLGAGDHTLNVTFTPTDTTDYTAATDSVTLHVNQAPLLVTANNASRLYGAGDPTFTASYSGFVNGDTTSILSGGPSLTSTDTPTSPAGSYTITAAQGTLSAGTNYTLAFVNGTLTILPAPVGVNVTATEGAAFANQAVATFTDPAGATALSNYSASIDWGDGTAATAGTITVSGSTFTVNGGHTYAEEGTNPITVSISYNGLSPATATSTATVADVPPTLTVSGPTSVNEGSNYTLNLSAVSIDPILSWTINWGDGSSVQTVSGNPSSVDHVYLDGTHYYTILASATTEDGTFAAAPVGGNAQASLDPAFGTGGEVTQNFNGSAADYARSVLVTQPDGKVLVAGFTQGGKNNIGLARYNPDGSLDTSFGNGGRVVTDFGVSETVSSMVLDGSGRILIGGDFGLARYNPDGSLDTSFGVNGWLNTFQYIQRVMFDANGDILVGGSGRLGRFLPNGTVDLSFGQNGTAYTQSSFADFTLDGSGRIVTTGYEYVSLGGNLYRYDLFVERFTSTGALDTTFGQNGRFTLDTGGDWAYSYKVVIQQGQILVGGVDQVEQYNASYGYYQESASSILLLRLTDAGTLDPTFGSAGTVRFRYNSSSNNNDYFEAMGVDPDGRILVRGSYVYRFAANGSPDTSFGMSGTGYTSTPIYTYGESNDTFAFDSAQRIYLGGYYYNGTQGANFAVERFSDSGTPDSSFDSNPNAGVTLVQTDFVGPLADYIQQVAVQSDGKIVVAGYSQGGSTELILARYLADGELDPTFGTGGINRTGLFIYPSAEAVAADGTIYVANYNTIYRFKADGSLDKTTTGFGLGGELWANGIEVNSLAFDSQGRLLAGGYIDLPGPGGTQYSEDFAVARYSATGVLDTSFGTNGIATFDLDTTATVQSNQYVYGMAVDANDGVVLAGYTYDYTQPSTYTKEGGLIVHFNAAGQLDTSFGANGYILAGQYSGDSARSVARDAQGRILVGFSSGLLQRYLSNGSLDTTFGNNGSVSNSYYGVTALDVDSAGQILGAGGNTVARWNADGTPDTSFAPSGRLTIPARYVNTIAVDASGDVLTAGYTDGTGRPTGIDFWLARYRTGGLAVTVNDVAPQNLSITGPTSANEGDTITLTASATDPGILDDLTYTWNITRNGSTYLQASGSSVNIDFLDNGTYVATVTVSDGELSVSKSQTISVADVAPTATILNNGPITYGGTVTASFTSAYDPSSADTSAGFHYAYSIDDSGSALASATYANSGTSAGASVMGLHAGNHTIYARIIDKDGGFTQYSTVATVDSAGLTIRADDKSMTYGGTMPGLSATYTGLVNGDAPSAITGLVLSTAPATSHAGTYTITASGASDPDYSITLASGTLTIGQAALTITADDKSMTYGGTTPGLTATFTGLVNGDMPAAIASLALSTALAASHAGRYTITASGASDPDYSITLVNGTLTIGQAALTITADDKSMSYGGTTPGLTATFTGLVNGDMPAAIAGLALSTAPATSHAGTYTITASGAGDPDYSLTLVNGTLTIGQAALTITADDKSVTYGETMPGLTATYTGLVNGDMPAAIAGLALSTAPATSHAGTYTITASGASDPDYSITLVNGTLTIGQAVLMITADDKSMIYGGAMPALTASYVGLVNGDTQSVITGLVLSTVAATSHAGGYTITASGATDPDYAIALVNGTLTIGQAPLTITADDKSMIYGGTMPALTASYVGLLNGDTQSAITGLALSTVAASSHASSYTITASGATDTDYAITLANGTLTIGQAPLTITADDKSMIYGGAMPALTAHYVGLVNGDSQSAITGLGLSTVAASSHASSYTITASGATDPDYAITLVNGTLTIGQAALTITADNKSMTYGGTMPALTATYGGLVKGDTQSAITGLVLSTVAANSHVSSYTITASGATDSDYAITLVNGTLTINQAPLMTTADDKSMTYGGTMPALTAIYVGLVNGDTSAAIQNLSLSTVPATSHAGSYTITANGATDPDYSITLVNGTLTIGQAPLTITADSKAKVYGAPLPTLTASYSGLVNGDTPASLTTAPTLATTATTASPVGTYPITASGAVDANYAISYVSGTLSVGENIALVLLNAKSKGTLNDTGNGQVLLAGGGSAQLVSTNAAAVVASGNARISATEIDVEGSPGVATNGRASVSAQLVSGASGISDPFAAVPVPAASTATTSVIIGSTSVVTLQPGTYVGGISVSGSAAVTLMPGLYYLNGGGLTVTGGSLTGEGVTIYNAPQNGSQDAIRISGGSVNLTAPASGPYEGIAIFQDRSSNALIAISGQGALNVSGAIYAAAAPVNVSGNGQAHLSGNAASGSSARLVCDDLSVSGNGLFNIDASQNAPLGASTASASSARSGNSLFAVTGQPLTIVPLATFSASVSVSYTATIDWGDGSAAGTGSGSVTFAAGQLTVAGSHTFTDPGSYQIQIVVVGSDGSSTSAVATAVITDIAIESDPTQAGAQELAVGGTTGSDTISVSAGTMPGTVMVAVVNANGTITEGPFSPTGRVVVYGQSGNDVIGIAGNVTLPGWIFAGDGNDMLIAGGGPSVLVGGIGNDTLVAGSGRDLLIGGGGADSLVAGSGDDLMIGGHTAYDANDIALAAILAEWASADALPVRMADISDVSPAASRLNGNYFFTASGADATVFDDTSVDTFICGSSNDWLFGQFVKIATDPAVDVVKTGSGLITETETD